MFSYIKNQWLSISLKKKLGAFSVVVILVMGLSIAFNMLVMNFSLESFNVILNDNSLCYDVQESMEQEADAFELYVRERSWENAKQYRLACFKTESSLDALPFDYDVIGPERYARTWNIKNGYEGYQIFRDQVLHMDQSDEGFVEQLYRVYGMQGYLQTYARRLMQSTLKEGKRSYQEKVPLLYDLPYMIMACSVLMIITVICLTKLLSNTLIAPMVKLAHSSREIARNDFGGEDLVVENRDEMGELVQAFNKMKHATEGYINTLKEKNEMAERLHKEEVERIEMEKRLDAARLELLKSQINPHFLFNMLNNANILVKEDPDEASRLLTKLDDMLRYQLNDSARQEVFLSADIHFLTGFLELEKMRRDHFEYLISKEGDVNNVKIPPLLFIPFVENAIKHNPDSENLSYIYLYFRVEHDELTFTCENSKPLVPVKKETGGLGLSNVQRRLELLYGKDYSLRIEETETQYKVHLQLKL